MIDSAVLRLRGPFADILRRLPGRYDRLQTFLKDAPPDVVDDFCRLVRNYEDEVHRVERRARMPWTR
jgi:hypothetical protein